MACANCGSLFDAEIFNTVGEWLWQLSKLVSPYAQEFIRLARRYPASFSHGDQQNAPS